MLHLPAPTSPPSFSSPPPSSRASSTSGSGRVKLKHYPHSRPPPPPPISLNVTSQQRHHRPRLPSEPHTPPSSLGSSESSLHHPRPRSRRRAPSITDPSSSSEEEEPPTPRRRLHEYPYSSQTHTPFSSPRLKGTKEFLIASGDQDYGFKLPIRTSQQRQRYQGHQWESTTRMVVNGSPNGIGESDGRLQRKILIMGSRSVGKSSLTTQYVEPNSFAESYYPTIEAVHNKDIKHDGIVYDCEIIDTAGQDEYSVFNHRFAVGIHGYILVYSIASRQSFDMVRNLHEKIVEFQARDKISCVIVGQKCDLGGARQVKKEEGEALAVQLGARFIETSAKNNQNINDVFDLLMTEMRKEYNPPEEKKKVSWIASWFGGK